MMYHRLTDSLTSVGKLLPENVNIYDFINKDQDYYLSVYKYNEEQKLAAELMIDAEKQDDKGQIIKFKRPQGVKGIEDVVTDIIGFDFDHKTDLDLAKADTITVVSRLIEQGIDVDDILVSFSGGKGFSVVVHHDKALTPEEHRTIAEGLAGDLQTFDTTLYNASRIFRIDGTKHQTTGLYKTPLDPDDLHLSIDEIKNKAKVKTKRNPVVSIKLPAGLLKLKPKVKEVKKTEVETSTFIDFSKKPFYLTDLKYVLQKGFIPPSDGNEGMMILCSTYKHVGFDRTDAYYMLKSVNEKRSEIYGIPKRTKSEMYEQVINVIYDPSWKGGTYSIENSKLLQETARKFGIGENSKIESFDSIKESFFTFADNINENVIKTGIKSLDETLLITTGMMVGILGAPSAGKTSIATSIIEKSAKEGMKPLFHSLDMTKHLMMLRLIQRQTGVNVQGKLRAKIKGDPNYDDSYSLREDTTILEAVENLGKIYRNVEFNFTRGASIESLEEDIKMNKAKNGDKFKLVVVDYLEKVRGPYNDSTANSGYVASRLSDLASTYDVCIILLLQPQKSAGDPSEELLSMRKVKGASVIEQDCRVILTVWRPGFDPRDSSRDKYMTIGIVKNNMGEVKTLDYKFDGLKGDVAELTKLEQDALDRLREDRKAEKAEEKTNGWNDI
jgi:replicative DNA helicase